MRGYKSLFYRHIRGINSQEEGTHLPAGLFEQAVSLDPKAEDGYFAYARYLDQHMRDARERQDRVRAARAEAQARAKDGASNLHYDINKDDRLGGRSK